MSKLTAYLIDGHQLDLRPAPPERPWMDDTDQRFAYRCLPLNIANGHGWEALCASAFSAVWDGRSSKEAIRIVQDPGTTSPVISHFGNGVLTFHVPCLFRTAPGFDLFVTGPINQPKDGIAPLTAIVETDWAPYTFTMNWRFTRASAPVVFAKGEPFCHFFPVERGRLELIEPELRCLSEAPEIEAQHKLWSDSRSEFNRDLRQPESQAARDRWQKLYFRGRDAANAPAPIADHRSKLRLQPFRTPSDEKS